MGSYIKGPPNPTNSPIEKIEVVDFANPAEAQRVFTKALIDQGVDKELAQQIGRAYMNTAELENRHYAEVQRQIQDWQNIHTHPGTGGGGVDEGALADLWTQMALAGQGNLNASMCTDGTDIWDFVGSSLRKYTVATDTDSVVSTTGTAGFGDRSACGIYNGRFYVAGYSSVVGTAQLAIYSVALAGGAWTGHTHNPGVSARVNATGGMVGKLLYVIGGSNPSTGTALDQVAIYDADLDSWSLGAVMPEAIKAGGIGGGYDPQRNGFWVVGGIDAGGVVRSGIWFYDIATDTWTTGLTPMTTAVYFNAATVALGKVYVTGGLISGGTNHYEHTVYTPSTDSWNDTITDAHTSHSGTYYGRSVTVADKLYVLLATGTQQAMQRYG